MNEFENADQYLMHAYGRHQVALEKGEGVYLYDTNGNKYLDFYSGIGVNALGYHYPGYDEALHHQIDQLLHVSNYFYTPTLMSASEKVVKATGLDKVFFANSGAEATEGALKLARKYYFNKHHTSDSEIISFHHSFHGRTTGSVKLTGNPHYQEAFGPLIEGVKYATLNDIDSVKRLVTDKTAAIIVEPVQGEGGVNPCTKEFLQALRTLCDEKDICLILDEVQSGMGRTGAIMTYKLFDIEPDILALAKGLGCGVPVGAFVANKKYGAALVPGDHGSTYGGNPFVCAAVNAVFDIFEKDHIVEHVSELTPYLVEQLNTLVDECEIVESIRGLGFMQGIVLKENKSGEIVKKALDKGLIIVSAGADVVRLLPPLVITKEHIDEAISILKEVLQ